MEGTTDGGPRPKGVSEHELVQKADMESLQVGEEPGGYIIID